MKKSLLFISALALGATSFAQDIPNGDFETWSDATTPSDWSKQINITGLLTSAVATVDQSAGTNGGSAIKVKTGALVGNVVPGVSLAGANASANYNVVSATDLSLNTQSSYGSIPATIRPVSISGTAKYYTDSTNRGSIIVLVYAGGVVISDTIMQLIDATTSFTHFNLPITYPTAGTTIDSIKISLATQSPSDTTAYAGDSLIVDQLRFLSCVVDANLVTTGNIFQMLPDTNNVLNGYVPSGAFSQVFSIYLPDTLFIDLGALGTITADVDSARLFDLIGDFAGFSTDCGGPCVLMGGSVGCITVTGTFPDTNNIAYELNFQIDPFGTIDTVTGDAADLVTVGADIQATLTPLGGAAGILPAMATYDVHVGTVGIEDFSANGSFNVSGNYPNPFNGSTTINFNTTFSGSVDFTVVDVLGRQVYDTNITATAGSNTFVFTTDLASGTYFFSISDGTNTITQKMVVSGGN